MKRILLFSFLCTLSAFYTLSYAAVITDSDVYNDGNLEWLHFDKNAGLTAQESIVEFSSFGFRFATVEEANTLINNWFGLEIPTGTSTVTYNTDLASLISAFRIEFLDTLPDTAAFGLVQGKGLFGARNNGRVFSNYMPHAYGVDGNSYEDFASYMLVRDTSEANNSIPEPSTIAIFTFAIVGLVSRRFLKKAQFAS